MQDYEYERGLRQLRLELLDIKCEMAAQRVLAACRRLIAVLGKANFNPGQLRIPAGEPGRGAEAMGTAASSR